MKKKKLLIEDINLYVYNKNMKRLIYFVLLLLLFLILGCSHNGNSGNTVKVILKTEYISNTGKGIDISIYDNELDLYKQITMYDNEERTIEHFRKGSYVLKGINHYSNNGYTASFTITKPSILYVQTGKVETMK